MLVGGPGAGVGHSKPFVRCQVSYIRCVQRLRSAHHFQLHVGAHRVTAPHSRHSWVRCPCSSVPARGASQPTRTRFGPSLCPLGQWVGASSVQSMGGTVAAGSDRSGRSRTGPAPALPAAGNRVRRGRRVTRGPAAEPNPHHPGTPHEDPRHLRGHAADPAAGDRPPHPGPVELRAQVIGSPPLH